MPYYAIRQKSTGYYLPVTAARNKTSVSVEKGKAPRLFTKKSAATLALQWWLEGQWSTKYYHASYDEQDSEELVVEKKLNRHGDDMEIVKVQLEVVL